MSENSSIRLATIDDVDAIRALTREAYSKWVPVIGFEPLPMGADYDKAVRTHRIDLMHLDGQLVALIEMSPEADTLLIVNVAVSPTMHGRGLGQRLLAHADRVAASLGRNRIRLYTNKLFAENIRLYRKLGYAIDREETFKDRIVVHMSKPVPA